MARTELPRDIRIGAEMYTRVPGTNRWVSGDVSAGPWRVFIYKNKRWSYEARTHKSWWPNRSTYATPWDAYHNFWLHQRERLHAEFEQRDALLLDEMVANPNPQHPETEGAQ